MSAERVGSFFWAAVGIISVYGSFNTGLVFRLQHSKDPKALFPL
jgi:hypothetical protein